MIVELALSKYQYKDDIITKPGIVQPHIETQIFQKTNIKGVLLNSPICSLHSQEPLFAAALVLVFIYYRAASPVYNGYGLMRSLPFFRILFCCFAVLFDWFYLIFFTSPSHPIKHEARTYGNLLPGLFLCLMTTQTDAAEVSKHGMPARMIGLSSLKVHAKLKGLLWRYYQFFLLNSHFLCFLLFGEAPVLKTKRSKVGTISVADGVLADLARETVTCRMDHDVQSQLESRGAACLQSSRFCFLRQQRLHRTK